MKRSLAAALALMFSVTLAAAQLIHEGAGQHSHHNRFDNAERWSKTFDDPKRDACQKPHELLMALDLKPRIIVAISALARAILPRSLARQYRRAKSMR